MMTDLADSQVELGSPCNTGITIHQAALVCWVMFEHLPRSPI